LRTTLELAEFPGATALLLDYAQHFERVAGWFSYNPHDLAALDARLAELDERERLDVFRVMDRGAWTAALYAQQQRFGCGQAALDAARKLGQSRCYSVVTGQQAGLLGGPLYALLKAATIVKLARQLKARYPECEFVPTFWISSEDSDFDEVRTARLLDSAGQLREIALPPAAAEDYALIVGRRDVSAALPAALAELEQALPSGQYRDAALALLREAYGEGAEGSLVTGFAHLMARLFDGTELVLVDPQDPLLAQAGRALIKRELSDPAAAQAVLARRNAEIKAAGYPLQVEQLSGDTSLFLLDERGRREKLACDEQGFCLRRSARRISIEELNTLAELTPERFVCGVMLRPLFQNSLFPCAAWIGGAAEISYRAQCTAAFDWHGQRMAPAFLRASATLLPARSAAQLNELGWELPQLYAPAQAVAARAAAQAMPQGIESAMAHYREVLYSADEQLKQQAVQLDPSLAASFDTLRGNLDHHVEKLEKKISGVLKQQQETLLKRVQQVQTQAFPMQSPQERMLCVASFLPRYGLGLAAQLIERLEVPAWSHQVVVLD